MALFTFRNDPNIPANKYEAVRVISSAPRNPKDYNGMQDILRFKTLTAVKTLYGDAVIKPSGVTPIIRYELSSGAHKYKLLGTFIIDGYVWDIDLTSQSYNSLLNPADVYLEVTPVEVFANNDPNIGFVDLGNNTNIATSSRIEFRFNVVAVASGASAPTSTDTTVVYIKVGTINTVTSVVTISSPFSVVSANFGDIYDQYNAILNGAFAIADNELHVAPSWNLASLALPANKYFTSLTDAVTRAQELLQTQDNVSVILHPGTYTSNITLTSVPASKSLEIKALSPASTMVHGKIDIQTGVAGGTSTYFPTVTIDVPFYDNSVDIGIVVSGADVVFKQIVNTQTVTYAGIKIDQGSIKFEKRYIGRRILSETINYAQWSIMIEFCDGFDIAYDVRDPAFENGIHLAAISGAVLLKCSGECNFIVTPEEGSLPDKDYSAIVLIANNDTSSINMVATNATFNVSWDTSTSLTNFSAGFDNVPYLVLFNNNGSYVNRAARVVMDNVQVNLGAFAFMYVNASSANLASYFYPALHGVRLSSAVYFNSPNYYTAYGIVIDNSTVGTGSITDCHLLQTDESKLKYRQFGNLFTTAANELNPAWSSDYNASATSDTLVVNVTPTRNTGQILRIV